ncbi:hypothetical protein MRY87_01405 [bacterium]|nr:hypothetical protein [bacterium]
MAKIGLEGLLAQRKKDMAPALRHEGPQGPTPPEHPIPREINKLSLQQEPAAHYAKKRMSLEEAVQLGAELPEKLASEAGAVEAQGAGLTEARVRALLED